MEKQNKILRQIGRPALYFHDEYVFTDVNTLHSLSLPKTNGDTVVVHGGLGDMMLSVLYLYRDRRQDVAPEMEGN